MRFGPFYVAAFLACACTPRINTDPVTGDVDLDMEPVTQQGQVWNANLTGQGSFAGVSGTAQATVLSGRTNVTIALQGATVGAAHPWHVHEGSCGSAGAIVGSSSTFPPLQVGSEGQAQSAMQLPLALNEARGYYVDVHASSSDMGTIIACGVLDD